MAIVAGVLVTVITTLNSHLGAADRLESISTATILARDKIEEINIKGIPADKQGSFEGGMSAYRWSLVTEDMNFFGVKKILLTVSWGAGTGTGAGNGVTMETYSLSKK